MTAWGPNSEWIFVNASSTCGWNSEAWWYLGAGIWKLLGNERTGQMKEKWWLKIWRQLPIRRLFRTLERDIHGQILNQVQFQNLKIEENPQASDWKKISTSQQFRVWKQARISPVMPLSTKCLTTPGQYFHFPKRRQIKILTFHIHSNYYSPGRSKDDILGVAKTQSYLSPFTISDIIKQIFQIRMKQPE